MGLRNDGGSLGLACRVSPLGFTWLSMCESSTWNLISGSHMRARVEMSHTTVSMRKKEFKYPNPTPTNTEAFCDKTPHLTDCAGGNYQVGDNVNVIEVRPLARLSNNSTWYQT